MAALQYVHVPGYAALILRRDFQRLNLAGAIMDRSKAWLRRTPARWNEQAKRWSFPSGATIEFGYVDSPDDRYRYASSEYQFIGYDELTEFRLSDDESNPYTFLFSRLRKTRDMDVPLRVRAASNPGNIGHAWVKARFLSEESERAIRDGIGGIFDGPGGRKFVPAAVRDNPALDAEQYAESLSHLPPITRARLLGGDWTVAESLMVNPSWLDRRYLTRGEILDDGGNVIDCRVCRRFATIDTAGTSKDKAAEDRGRAASWSVLAVWDWHQPSGRLFPRHVGRWRVTYPELKARAQQTLTDWRCQKAYIENAHFGPALAGELPGVTVELIGPMLPGMAGGINGIGVGGAKLERATAAGLFTLLESGRLILPNRTSNPPAWLSDYESELLGWTGREGETADQIDVTSYAAYVTRRQGGSWGGVIGGGGLKR